MRRARSTVSMFAGVLVSFGVVLLASPFFLYAWLHWDMDRYRRIISGPFPFSQLGSGPVQLWLSVGLFMAGLLCTVAGVAEYLVTKKKAIRKRRKAS